MSDSLDDFVQDLQEQIFEETKAAYGEIVYQRWRNPLYMGKMENSDAHAHVKGECGDTIEIFLKFKNDRIKEASFLTDGCGPSAVCGSFAAEVSIGKSPDEIIEITGEVILKKLGGLPEEDRHCAFLAAATLQEALNTYMIGKTLKNARGRG
ncbi:iron-sulfur cluster assembly scaffold protein [Desulfobacteraceae bacterium SEEP-SAG9]|nr:iron-sulfur cluster assembly scaffold protein [Desulfobacteraceae bacterium SEEP-SAG9]